MQGPRAARAASRRPPRRARLAGVTSFHLSLFPYDRWGGLDAMGEMARLADDLGFGGLGLPDHVAMPVRPGREAVSVVWYDPFVLASHLATLTRRLRLVFNVLVVPYRHPVVLAKAVSTLDVVSGGRVTLGVGAGWLKGEFRLLGIPFEERGARTDEALRAMKALWTRDRPEFEGRTVSFSNLAFEPKCVQRPHVRLWIGGSGPAPLRRAAELGDGWSPMTGDLSELERGVSWIRERARAVGRDPVALDFAFGIAIGRDPQRDRARSHAAGAAQDADVPDSSDAIVDRAGRLREIGFDHIGLSFAWERPVDYLRRLEALAKDVLPQCA